MLKFANKRVQLGLTINLQSRGRRDRTECGCHPLDRVTLAIPPERAGGVVWRSARVRILKGGARYIE